MSFTMPAYIAPDFSRPELAGAPDARTASAPRDGIAPDGYHSTSLFPEYVKLGGTWRLIRESRMDSSVVVRPDGELVVVENRNLRAGDSVLLGRTEDGSEGILVHADAFREGAHGPHDRFVFRQGRSRETSYARDYDRLIELLDYEREHGFVLWVMGPAFAFDHDARAAMQALIEAGYADGLLAGNALATHDLEAAALHTALGQDIYTQEFAHNGHYNHLDVINDVRACGSIGSYVRERGVSDGIMFALERNHVPYVLAGSIRDDGPLPGVIGDAYAGQTAMRELTSKATTVICLATMLHTIAAGNLTPSYHVNPDGSVRPVFFYAVDAEEFVVNKLIDRGSLTATTIVTNVQDFITIVARGVKAF